MDDVRATQSPVDHIAGAPVSWGVCDGDADVPTIIACRDDTRSDGCYEGPTADIRPSTKHPARAAGPTGPRGMTAADRVRLWGC
jgi:hypothetical protein